MWGEIHTTQKAWYTLNQCWLNVEPASQTMVQHWNNIGSVYRSDCKNSSAFFHRQALAWWVWLWHRSGCSHTILTRSCGVLFNITTPHRLIYLRMAFTSIAFVYSTWRKHFIIYNRPGSKLKSGWQHRPFPANTKHLYNICKMLGQRRRRWDDIVQMLYKCFVFAGLDND